MRLYRSTLHALTTCAALAVPVVFSPLVAWAQDATVSVPAAAPPDVAEIRVTLLGTGTPRPLMARFGPSILVEAGREKIVVDVGRGACQRLWQLGVSYSDITAVLLTHLHSDHVVGLPDSWLTGWLISRADKPLELWGPAGTTQMATHLEAAFEFDRAIRVSDDGVPPPGGHLAAHDIGEQTVFERNGVKVSAFFRRSRSDQARARLTHRLRRSLGRAFRGHAPVADADSRRARNGAADSRGRAGRRDSARARPAPPVDRWASYNPGARGRGVQRGAPEARSLFAHRAPRRRIDGRRHSSDAHHMGRSARRWWRPDADPCRPRSTVQASAIDEPEVQRGGP